MNKIIKNTLIGAAGGAVLGTVGMGARMLGAVTAPISYPVCGIVNGYRLSNHLSLKGRWAAATIVGSTIVHTALIPLAPVAFITAPLMIPVTTVTMGVVGGVVGSK